MWSFATHQLPGEWICQRVASKITWRNLGFRLGAKKPCVRRQYVTSERDRTWRFIYIIIMQRFRSTSVWHHYLLSVNLLKVEIWQMHGRIHSNNEKLNHFISTASDYVIFPKHLRLCYYGNQCWYNTIIKGHLICISEQIRLWDNKNI
jgi:hypothetical protein